MFWGPASGGVRRYIGAKRNWIAHHTAWQHSTVVPMAGGAADEDDLVGVPSLPLPFAPGYRVARSRRRSAARLLALAPDLIEAGDPYNLAWAALDAARELRVPAVAFAHSDIAALAWRVGGAPAEAMAQRYLRRLYSQFSLVLAPGASLTQRLRGLQLDAPVEQQPLGVDTRCFHPAAADPAWRQQFGLPAATRLLLYAGRFSPEKNLPVLVEAVRRLGAGFALIALGGGPTPPQSTGQARVIVLPFERNPRRLARAIASSDLFVHAGDIETFGLAALEAMACGTPVVAHAGGGLAELVDSRVGEAVAQGAATAFAEAITATVRRRREDLSAAARARSLPYDWGRVMPRLLQRYARLIDAAARGARASQSALPQLMAMSR